MNIFTNLSIATTILLSVPAMAQQDNTKVVNIPSSINENYSFGGSWTISNDGSNYNVSGTRLTNNSNKASAILTLGLYFAPKNSTIDLSRIPNNTTTFLLGKLDGNGSSLSNLNVSFKDQDIKNSDFGDYTPVLLLKERSSGKIIGYKVIDNNIAFKSNTVIAEKDQINRSGVQINPTETHVPVVVDIAKVEEIKTPVIQSNIEKSSTNIPDIVTNKKESVTIKPLTEQVIIKEVTSPNEDMVSIKETITPIKVEETVVVDSPAFSDGELTEFNAEQSYASITENPDNIYVPFGSSLETESANKNIKLNGKWSLEIDFEKLTVDLAGDGNSIENLSKDETGNLRLLVYFSKENIADTASVDGYEFVFFDILSLRGKSKLNKLEFSTNITKFIPSGEYYPVLVLTEKNKSGNYVVKSTLSLGDKYDFGK